MFNHFRAKAVSNVVQMRGMGSRKIVFCRVKKNSVIFSDNGGIGNICLLIFKAAIE